MRLLRIRGAPRGAVRWSVASDRVTGPHRLGLRPAIIGRKRQGGSVSGMISCAHCLSWYLSPYTVSHLCDLIDVGTPPTLDLPGPPPLPASALGGDRRARLGRTVLRGGAVTGPGRRG